MTCPLCGSPTTDRIDTDKRGASYFKCPTCDLIFLDPNFHLSEEEEKKRYLTHENDITDIRYQNFVRPLYDVICSRARPESHGLDFGAGTGPVLTSLLSKQGYAITCYDPFFYPDVSSLRQNYDFVFACEVVEHLYSPAREFLQLKALLRPQGFIAIMTLMHLPTTDFQSWYYRNDPTHVVFYSPKTFEWIRRVFKFSKLEILSDRIIVLSTV